MKSKLKFTLPRIFTFPHKLRNKITSEKSINLNTWVGGCASGRSIRLIKPFSKYKRTEVLNILNAKGGKEWVSNEDFDFDTAYHTIIKCNATLDLNNDTIDFKHLSVISKWQTRHLSMAHKALELHLFSEAYHEIWDVIDDMHSDVEYITDSELLLIKEFLKLYIDTAKQYKSSCVHT